MKKIWLALQNVKIQYCKNENNCISGNCRNKNCKKVCKIVNLFLLTFMCSFGYKIVKEEWLILKRLNCDKYHES